MRNESSIVLDVNILFQLAVAMKIKTATLLLIVSAKIQECLTHTITQPDRVGNITLIDKGAIMASQITRISGCSFVMKCAAMCMNYPGCCYFSFSKLTAICSLFALGTTVYQLGTTLKYAVYHNALSVSVKFNNINITNMEIVIISILNYSIRNKKQYKKQHKQ